MIDICGMFLCASSFNEDLSKWDLFNVISMSKMFNRISCFDQDLCGAWFTSTVRECLRSHPDESVVL